MATPVTATRFLFSESAAADGVRRAVKVVARLVKNLRHRREVQQLGDLDTAMLKDIGLTRSDVVAALCHPLLSDPSDHLRRVAAGRGHYPMSRH